MFHVFLCYVQLFLHLSILNKNRKINQKKNQKKIKYNKKTKQEKKRIIHNITKKTTKDKTKNEGEKKLFWFRFWNYRFCYLILSIIAHLFQPNTLYWHLELNEHNNHLSFTIECSWNAWSNHSHLATYLNHCYNITIWRR